MIDDHIDDRIDRTLTTICAALAPQLTDLYRDAMTYCADMLRDDTHADPYAYLADDPNDTDYDLDALDDLTLTIRMTAALNDAIRDEIADPQRND